MAGGGTLPFTENNTPCLLCLAKAAGEYNPASSEKAHTGTAPAEPGFSRQQNAEPADAPVGL
ncbi:hypothetical protein KP22_16130 [Pectobacterium betavasculorum]|uniref:Uncharacterized protein n=1 Tax=Pectobacterium betavasculorum TaxID=55207 RepID=A0A093SSS6_9GAMM|nr:hypothetical protein KP22_16130 [Pectobacterium betavasculorum]KFX18285.1 hypothetical protein JV35_16730 [Pectobacterium betavasculorum]